MRTLAAACVLLSTISLSAQVPDQPRTAPQAAPAPPASPAASKPGGSFLGKDVPLFDPGSNMLTWDGKSWNIANNEVFQARFEKYLSAPEETGADDKAYQAIIAKILRDLAPGHQTVASVDEAFLLLPKASNYDIDAHLCDTLADAVYSAWRAQNQAARLDQANAALEDERKKHEWNLAAPHPSLQTNPAPSKNPGAQNQSQKNADAMQEAQALPDAERLAEINILIKKNSALKEFNGLQMKVEFQALIVQFFLQRRFQHVLMATRFYRAVFSDGDDKLALGKQSNDLFANTTGMPPTVATIDSMANEAIRDVREGVQAFEFLLQKNELEGATKRLAEAFTVGEFMPELRTLPREEKQQALKFTQQDDQLVSALNVKDYALAEKIVQDLEITAKDFDNSKPLAEIEGAKLAAHLHIENAKSAMISGDKATLESELTQAVNIWPRNPELKEFTDNDLVHIHNPMEMALVDFETLLGQHNYRQIYEDKMRFIAAVTLDPKRAGQLKTVLDQMQKIETAMAEANIRSKEGDYPGAWENLESAYKDFPEDGKLNDMRATLTTEAPDFVHTLRTAQDLEQKNQIGSSLAWYLKAQKIYPHSEFARAGIDRLVKKIMPDEPEG